MMANVADDGGPALAADRAELVEALVNHSVTLMVEMTRQAGGGDAREAVLRWLRHAPLLCRQARDVLARSPVYAPLLFYEWARLVGERPVAVPRHFLDGVPRTLALFGAPTPLVLPVEQMEQLDYCDAMTERHDTLRKLDGMADAGAKMRQIAASLDRLPDVAAEVPMRVRLFVSRQRAMCAGLRAARPDRFRQCAHEQCARLFMVNWGSGAHPAPLLTRSVESAYWDQIEPMPVYAADACRFCSTACATQWRRQMEALLKGAVVERADPPDPPTYAPSEPSARRDFERAVKRNAMLCGVITKVAKRRERRARALSRHDVAREIEARVTRANVDLGLLYAAMLVMRAPQLVRHSYIPGQQAAWRTMATRYGPMGHRVACLYLPRREMMPVHALLRPCAFMSSIKTRIVSVLR